jgi:hypothetical protein
MNDTNMDQALHCKPVKINLVGIDGNAYLLMGAWTRAARKQERTAEEIKAVIDDCTSGNYGHLLRTLIKHTY